MGILLRHYPHLNEQQLLEVEDTLDRYLTFALRMFDRMEWEREQRQGTLPTSGIT